jgi:hypothetical protein
VIAVADDALERIPWAGRDDARHRVVAAPAHGHVLIRATNHLHLFVLADALRVGGLAEAAHADGGELDDVLCEGDQVYNVAEPLALEGGVEGGHEHSLAEVGHLLGEGDNVGKLRHGKT